jgi:hypothetical protein
MWPFNKPEKGGDAPASKPDDWTLCRGERDGFPMIVRLANAYQGLAPVPGYDHHVIVSAQFRSPSQSGFPSSEEGDDLETFEENLCGLLEAGNDSLCTLVITNNGLRDFIFYTRDTEGVKARLDAEVSKLKGFVFEVAIEPAEDWRIYKTFCGWLNPDPGTGPSASA